MRKYALIKEIGGDVVRLCIIARVSRSGYYKWLRHCGVPDKDHSDYILIKKIFDHGRGRYGWRSVQMKLLERGVRINHKKIIRIMRKYNLVATIRQKNHYKLIMKKSHEHRTCENKLQRNFTQTVPYAVFCTDITYLWFNHRFAYLSVVKDIASGEVVGWKLSQHLEMSIVLDTVKNMRDLAILPLTDVLIHSDQGFHYTNPLYIKAVKKLNMIQSMSRKANCIDNAPIESFFGHLKDDVDHRECKTFEELENRIAQYVRYYNTKRAQWDRKKMTPVAYRNHLLAQR